MQPQPTLPVRLPFHLGPGPQSTHSTQGMPNLFLRLTQECLPSWLLHRECEASLLFSSLRSSLNVRPQWAVTIRSPNSHCTLFTSGLKGLSHDRPHRSSGPCKQLESEMALDQKWKLSGKTWGPRKHEKEVCLLHWLKKQDGTCQADMGKREESGNGLPSHASPSEQSPCGAQ